jgi:hypothetical protein
MPDEYAIGSGFPIIRDFKAYSRVTFVQPIQLYLDDVPWNLSNGTIDFVVKSDITKVDKILSLSIAHGNMDDAANGKFTIFFSAADMDIPSATGDSAYSYGMMLTIAPGDTNFPEGLSELIYVGKFAVVDSVFTVTV